MPPSERTVDAVRNMRKCLRLQQEFREAASVRFKEAKDAYRKAYAKTVDRNTLGDLEYTVDQRAKEDPHRKDLVGDEQFYRGLTQMYAAVAQVELALDEAREREDIERRSRQGRPITDQPSHDLRNADTSRAE